MPKKGETEVASEGRRSSWKVLNISLLEHKSFWGDTNHVLKIFVFVHRHSECRPERASIVNQDVSLPNIMHDSKPVRHKSKWPRSNVHGSDCNLKLVCS